MNNQNRRRILQVTGILLVLVGLGLILSGLAGLTYPIACAINGCPSLFSAYYAIYLDEISVGSAMILLGIGIILASRKIKLS